MRTELYSGDLWPIPLLPRKDYRYLSNSDRGLPHPSLETSSEAILLSPGKSTAVLAPLKFFPMSEVNLFLFQFKPVTSFCFCR